MHASSGKPAPARCALARSLYIAGASMAEIRRQTGFSSAGAYYWIDREVTGDGAVRFSPVPRRTVQPAGGRPVPAPAGRPDRKGLLRRLWRAAERQINEIEDRLARAADPVAEDAAPRAAADTEKDARALAVLARTLRELSALEADARKMRKAKTQDDGIRDLDSFRRELARRLDRLREGGDGAGPAGGPA
ncbi:hypothetical protein ABLE93_00530 [Xanthobacter sp. KR7-65]|uniref:hypothetical protein n=1 Tax=Xanthobacter sp. KR7-65 TaxID=3156612 RepID=UPI0032B57482